MRKPTIVYGMCLVVLTAALGCATVATDEQACNGGGVNRHKESVKMDERRSAPRVALFDGKTLKGWEGNLEWFRIEDGAIVGGKPDVEKIEKSQYLCTTKEYADFELHVQAKLVGEVGNAGILLRSRWTPDRNAVSGYLADMGKAPGRFFNSTAPYRYVWACMFDDARRNKMLAVSDEEELAKAHKPGEWNEYLIRCEGNRIQLWLNDHQLVDYTEADDSIESTGIIGLKVRAGDPCEVWFKDITIQEIR